MLESKTVFLDSVDGGRAAVADSDSQDLSDEEGVLNVGHQLRSKREALGLTTEAVEHQLHLQLGYIEFLETAQWDRLPGPVFLRGYLLAYCRLLNLDVNHYLPVYEAAWLQQTAFQKIDNRAVSGQGSARELRVMNARTDASVAPDLRGHVGLIIVLVGLVWGVWVWESGQEEGQTFVLEESTASLQKESVQKESSEKTQQTPLFEANTAALNGKTDTMLPLGRSISLLESPPQVVVTYVGYADSHSWLVGQPVFVDLGKALSDHNGAVRQEVGQDTLQQDTLQEVGQDTLEVYFVSAAHIEISDRDGNNKVDNAHSAGATLKVGGMAPFTVSVADPDAVIIKFNQQVAGLRFPSRGKRQ